MRILTTLKIFDLCLYKSSDFYSPLRKIDAGKKDCVGSNLHILKNGERMFIDRKMKRQAASYPTVSDIEV